ncbi:hypothetical protein TNCT_552431 [Trichonephila clavata]|uniref:Uncharacterized protein n=1 Tax=Trichonephila clavata TaxID=2740835 RepID=A0A8X6F1Z1_TRICU|nr:hypothetical protein TNCT_552431 [Trichonephila clavata]
MTTFLAKDTVDKYQEIGCTYSLDITEMIPESASLVNKSENKEKPDESENDNKSDVLQKIYEIPVISKWPDIKSDDFITNVMIQKIKSYPLENTEQIMSGIK